MNAGSSRFYPPEFLAMIWQEFILTGCDIQGWINEVLAMDKLPYGDACGGPCPECPNFCEGCSRVGSCALGL
jgi:hypothetical protein